jgi:DNA-binding transcriptional ArsR family regulator
MRTASTHPLTSTLIAIADPTRRGILARLALGEATVNELAAPYDMSVAAVSKHLNVLEAAGLISRRKEAQYRHCRLRPEPLEAVSLWLEDYRRFWERSLDALDDHLITMQREAQPKAGAPARKPRRRRKDAR